MMETDSYLTIKAFSQGVYKDKGSRFIAYAYPVSSTEEIKTILEDVRKEHHDARHHCFAYMLGPDRQAWRVSDDGEPSGTAGKPILGQINSYGLTNILIIVTRYFGGKLLGVSGLINSYRTASEAAIVNGEIITKVVRDFLEIRFPYSSMNDIMKIIKEENLLQSDQHFDQTCRLVIGFKRSSREHLINLFSRVEGLIFSLPNTI